MQEGDNGIAEVPRSQRVKRYPSPSELATDPVVTRYQHSDRATTDFPQQGMNRTLHQRCSKWNAGAKRTARWAEAERAENAASVRPYGSLDLRSRAPRVMRNRTATKWHISDPPAARERMMKWDRCATVSRRRRLNTSWEGSARPVLLQRSLIVTDLGSGPATAGSGPSPERRPGHRPAESAPVVPP